MVNLDSLFLVIALILFLLGAAQIPSKVNLTSLGLFFFTLTFLI